MSNNPPHRQRHTNGTNVPGHGTSNRPWVLDDVEDSTATYQSLQQPSQRSSYDRYLLGQQQQQQQRTMASRSNKNENPNVTSAVSATSTTTPNTTMIDTSTYTQQQQQQKHHRIPPQKTKEINGERNATIDRNYSIPSRSSNTMHATVRQSSNINHHLPSLSSSSQSNPDTKYTSRSSSSEIIETSMPYNHYRYHQQQAQASAPSPPTTTNTTTNKMIPKEEYTARELRTRRLQQQQQQQHHQEEEAGIVVLGSSSFSSSLRLKKDKSKNTTSTGTTTTGTGSSNNNSIANEYDPHLHHFQAHNAAVEKYLQRSRNNNSTPPNNNNIITGKTTSSRAGMINRTTTTDTGTTNSTINNKIQTPQQQQQQYLSTQRSDRTPVAPHRNTNTNSTMTTTKNTMQYQRPMATSGILPNPSTTITRTNTGDVRGINTTQESWKRSANTIATNTGTTRTIRVQQHQPPPLQQQQEVSSFHGDGILPKELQTEDNINQKNTCNHPSSKIMGWSTIKRNATTIPATTTTTTTDINDNVCFTDADTGIHNVHKDEKMDHSHHCNSSSSIGENSNKVDEYLKRRNQLKDTTIAYSRLLQPRKKEQQQQSNNSINENSTKSMTSTKQILSMESNPLSNATMSIAAEPAGSYQWKDSSSSDSSLSSETSRTALELDWTMRDNENIGDGCTFYSVKACIISAVDFPSNVIPNMPFSPVLKVGLVQLRTASRPVDSSSQQQQLHELTMMVERDGLMTIPYSQIRSTSTKILSKRDNGAIEYHEEIRWDHISTPDTMVLVLELSSRAVLTPANVKESPPSQRIGPLQFPTTTTTSSSPHVSIGHGGSLSTSKGTTNGNDGRNTMNTASTTTTSGLQALFQKIRKSDSNEQEMEEANMAAAVAKLLVQGDSGNSNKNNNKSSNTNQSLTTGIGETGPLFDKKQPIFKTLAGNQSEVDVQLRGRKRIRPKRTRKIKMTDELRLGCKVIPLNQLDLERSISESQTVRIEQWFELDTTNTTISAASPSGTSPSTSRTKRNPSILVEISFSTPNVSDDSEDDMEDESTGNNLQSSSYSKRASLKIRQQLKQEIKPDEIKIEEPMLEPGLIDYICVVGARDIGDQKADDGARGWVHSTPECCILEQFPPDDDFHTKNGRSAVLPGKVEWFCFPDGCKLWRGLTPPNYDELNLKRFSASSPVQVSTSFACFDACLGCTTSFSWFVIASNSDKYGSESKKTYGAVVRFYVPAPIGIDPTQDDFGQMAMGGSSSSTATILDQSDAKRLWVPIGICVTSSLPIVGTMEVILLRLCEALSTSSVNSATAQPNMNLIHNGLAAMIVHFQKPIPGAVSCSFPFLEGERLHIGLPPRKCLPPLPHGNAIASVCRLLGADGLNYLLAAFMTECKILLHSDDIANLSLVAEVLTALLYPFQWALPYVPVLPAEMMEFIEAPLSYLLGVPSCNMQLLDPTVLQDVVVVDLDRDFSSSSDSGRSGLKSRSPEPLPATMASNLSKAVHRLLRVEDEIEATMDSTNFPGMRSFPRMEAESLPEREFRVSVAMEVCALIRGYDECLVFSSSQPVFNVEKFLQIAPAIFEEQRVVNPGQGQQSTRHVISPRSRRFVSTLVCCQHFHQFLEILEADTLAFFHRIMRYLENKSARKDNSLAGRLLSLDSNTTISELCKTLQSMEDKTPTYRIKNYESDYTVIHEKSPKAQISKSNWFFPSSLLQQIVVKTDTDEQDSSSEGVKKVSMEYLVELEKNPWRYQRIFDIATSVDDEKSSLPVIEKIKLREAIGDRRYRAWKSNLSIDKFDNEESSIFSEDSKGFPAAFDLTSLVAAATNDLGVLSSTSSHSAKVDSFDEDATDIVRRCLESADSKSCIDDDTLLKAEDALRDRSAQQFLLEVLNSRKRKGFEKAGDLTSPVRKRSMGSGGSKLDQKTFEILIRLSFAMLDVCLESKCCEPAYALLTVTVGLYTTEKDAGNEISVIYLTERIGLHPVYADLNLWDKARAAHLTRSQLSTQGKSEGETIDEQFEAVVATLYEMNGYGIPAEELARFASRMCKEHGWYHSERGQTLLMLAKRVCLRRDKVHNAPTPANMSDLALMSPSPSKRPKSTLIHLQTSANSIKNSNLLIEDEMEWIELAWCHPAAQSSRRALSSDAAKRNSSPQTQYGRSDSNEFGGYMRRSAVTSIAYLGSSVVVTGGLDGGVFMARKVNLGDDTPSEPDRSANVGIRGVHLDWGSSGSRYADGSSISSLDGEYGVGAVTCLAATRATGPTVKKSSKDVIDALADEDILEAMDGCRVVAGTTCGDLRVWSVKDVFSAVFYASRGGDSLSTGIDLAGSMAQRTSVGSFGAGYKKTGTDFAAGSSLTRLKFSLRGRALSGHRGGVCCIDVHSSFYRPDSIVSGGADGLIKMWSLRAPGTPSTGRRTVVEGGKLLSAQGSEVLTPRSKAARSGDALSILSGHGGRIICVKTAWHGDRLLSGGADRTVRLWDLSTSGGKCLNSLSGHFGWVTSVHYWGPNTIISASTDRTVALWDARVRNNAPLFTLRHHNAPVSDILVGPRTDPVMLSAATDGSIAAWDFRQLTGMNTIVLSSSSSSCTTPTIPMTKETGKARVVRTPQEQLYLPNLNKRQQHSFGTIHLCRGSSQCRKTAYCLGSDTILREWDYQTGDIVQEHVTGHCDAISNLIALGEDTVLDATQLESCGTTDTATTTISTSWDGTIRLRHKKCIGS